MRKTVDILPILEYANRQLVRTDYFADEKFKAGVCSMIETVLLESGNYSGFHFLNEDSVPGSSDYYNRFYHTPPHLR
jgi:hypothetical protein